MLMLSVSTFLGNAHLAVTTIGLAAFFFMLKRQMAH